VKVTVYDQTKKKIEDMELKEELFNSDVNIALLHQVVNAQRAAKRSGTASTKGRADVNGSTRKLFKQKGTGNARPGSIKSPLQSGGGVVFGPQPRSYAQKINKKMFKGALVSALSDKAKAGSLYIVDSLKFSETKTKNVSSLLKKFNIDKCLIVDLENNELTLSSRNIYGVKAVKPEQLNPYDLIRYENLIISKQAIDKVSEFIS
jgi:large subunit ribosomal protein L4